MENLESVYDYESVCNNITAIVEDKTRNPLDRLKAVQEYLHELGMERD